jgi:hypothetical protein
MAFPFSGRLRCYQHSQGDDMSTRESLVHPFVTPSHTQTFWVRVGFRSQARNLIGYQASTLFIIVMEYQSNLKSLKLLFINSSYDKLSSYLLIYYDSLDINAILLIHFTYIYFTTLLHLYCTVYI